MLFPFFLQYLGLMGFSKDMMGVAEGMEVVNSQSICDLDVCYRLSHMLTVVGGHFLPSRLSMQGAS